MLRSNALRATVATLWLVTSGCAPEATAGGAPYRTESENEPACAGDDPAAFCDDCNPCTTDANCTPCSALPEELRDIHHCTEDDELPPFCAGERGCVHVALTTAEGQSNSCFPVAAAADAHSGVCRSGACVEEER